MTFVPSCRTTSTVLTALAMAMGTAAQAQQGGSQEARSKVMRELARGVTVEAAGGQAELIEEPIYRFDDPARRFPDGTIWAFGKTGRPTALLTLALERS